MRIVLSIILLLSPLLYGKMFQTVNPKQAHLLQKGKDAPYCASCGMELTMFYKTSHAAKVNKEQKQFCSLHCLATAMQNNKDLKDIQVVDAKTLKWIDAKNAYYVVGSNIKGTMSRTSKYAFASKKDALEFQKKYGGEILDFNQAYKVALEDFQ
jgi:nitrous oxide reductase accessory protein NosL